MINTEELNINPEVEQKDEAVNLRDVLSKYIYHWPLFFLGVLICLTLAFVYLRYSQPIYAVNSVLLIKDDKNNGLPGAGDLLNELDLFGSSKIIDNEIEILKSKTLMRKVVDRLNLSITFKAEGRVKNADLYVGKPVNFIVRELNSNWYGKTFGITFPTSNSYQLMDKESGKIFTGTLNKVHKDDLGVYTIERNKYFNRQRASNLSVMINDPHFIVDQYLKLLSVTLTSKQSTVLSIGFQTAVPQKGQDILNTLVQVYNEAALTDKNKTIESTLQFIDDRLKLITGELTEVEKNVESFKSTRGLTDISSDANLFLESVKLNDAKLSEINLQISVIQDIKRYVNSSSSHEKLPSTLGISDPVLLGQITQLSELQLQKDQLLETTTEDNPLLSPLTRQIETTRAGIKASIFNISKALDVSKSNLEGNNNQFQGSIKKIPGQERQLISIKRQQTIKESLYLYLLQKKEEAALSYASAVADSRTVDPAFYSEVPIKPKRQLVYLFGLIIGLLLPLIYLYIKDLFNTKVNSVIDLTKITSAPILGEIMYNEISAPIVVTENSRKAIAEQFRSIRTNLQFSHGKYMSGKGKVTLFTSGMSGEGKTFVACNLAASLAISGKKTVLLELDLRKPKVSKYLNLNNQVGLSNYFIGQSEISDIIQNTDIHPNFYVAGSGPIPPNPSELVSQKEIEVLIDYLRDNFDEILIDSPPIGLVTDAQILSKFVDVTIYLVRQNVTYKDQVKNLEKIYTTRKFPRLNVILNGVKLGSNYGYGYTYGYGKGYYSDDETQKGWSLKSMLYDVFKRF